MAYSDFDLRKVTTDFSLTEVLDLDLFTGVAPLEPSDELRRWLDQFSLLALGFGSELARSVYLIGPVFAEVMRRAASPVLVFVGVTLDVDKARGLTGVCDYLMTRSREVYYVRGPLFAVVEAKKEDIGAGLGQCAAEMVAVRIFNEKDGHPLPAVYGGVTNGGAWRFLKLEADTLFIDKTEYHIQNVAAILGILVSIAGSAPPV